MANGDNPDQGESFWEGLLYHVKGFLSYILLILAVFAGFFCLFECLGWVNRWTTPQSLMDGGDRPDIEGGERVVVRTQQAAGSNRLLRNRRTMNQVATVQRGASLRPSVSSSASPETIPMSTFNAPSGSQANAPGTSGSQANAPGTSGSQANAPGTNQATPERRQSLRLKEAKNKTPAERKSSDPK